MLFAGGKVIAITQENKTTNVETVNSFLSEPPSAAISIPHVLVSCPVVCLSGQWSERLGLEEAAMERESPHVRTEAQ